MSSKCKPGMAVMAILMAMAGSSKPAEAAMVLKLDDGSNVVQIQDNAFGDLSPTPGIIMYNGTLGSGLNTWGLTLNIGESKPVIGPGALSLTSVDLSFFSAGTLTISLTDTGFTAPTGSLLLLQRVTGLTNLSTSPGVNVSVSGYQNNSGVQFATGGSATTGPVVINSSVQAASMTAGPFNVTAPYSMTEVATITFGAGGGHVGFSSDLSFNPEPTGIVLVGGVLLFLARAFRRRNSQS